MKVRRKPIADKYAEEIERLYAEKPGDTVHEPAEAQAAR